MQIKVSIIMPVYNSEKHLAEAVRSVLDQSLRDIELICVDDGSTDASYRMLEEHAARDERVTLTQQANSGPGAARNRGIDLARGQFIAFMDSDDLLGEPTYLETLHRAAVDNGQLVAAACFVNYRGKNKLERVFADPAFDGYTFAESGVVSYADYQFDYGFHRFLFSASLFEDGRNRFGDLRYFEDPVFLARILHQAASFCACSDVSYWYRCDMKPIRWTTAKLVDLLEGVRENLVFSSENNLAKLHWYTLRHLEEEAAYAGIGLDGKLDLGEIARAYRETAQAIDGKLLEDAGLPIKPETISVQRAIDEAAKNPKASRSLEALAFKAKRTLAPLYHTLRS